ncbi:hypothetical protein [Rhodococcus sp. NPDC059234]|uniref:hypothetical protein n=1 Tax=Rhodococcus sp. NPDC059234 TaxID=3346781 RepID=UPI00366D209F
MGSFNARRLASVVVVSAVLAGGVASGVGLASASPTGSVQGSGSVDALSSPTTANPLISYPLIALDAVVGMPLFKLLVATGSIRDCSGNNLPGCMQT